MSRIGSILLLLLVLLHGAAVAGEAVQVATSKIALKGPPYELIQFATGGESYGPASQRVRGRSHRLVVLSPVIAYDHPTLRIETLNYGDEACCIRLVAAYELPIEKLAEHGVALPEATKSEFKFHRWLSPQSLEFAYGSLVCVLRSLGSRTISVVCRP